MSGHRFINDGHSPIPMGASAEYGCICGKRGSHQVIAFHIAGMLERSKRSAAVTADFEGGDTMAHYLPAEPRRPAPTGETPPLLHPDRPRPGTPEPLPPPPPAPSTDACPTCGTDTIICDMPEISVWSCGHWIRKRPGSIAELFQDMLRSAFVAGAASTTSGQSFETWYQTEVLR